VENEETFGDLDNIARKYMTGEECTVQLDKITKRINKAKAGMEDGTIEENAVEEEVISITAKIISSIEEIAGSRFGEADDNCRFVNQTLIGRMVTSVEKLEKFKVGEERPPKLEELIKVIREKTGEGMGNLQHEIYFKLGQIAVRSYHDLETYQPEKGSRICVVRID